MFYAAVAEHVPLAPWQRRICAWIKSYADRGWPDETPRFMLSQLPSTLDAKDLSKLMTTEYRARVRACLGTEHHLVLAIRSAVTSHIDRDGCSVDVEAVAKLSLDRLDITSRRTRIPISLVEAYIADGRTDYAHRLAQELPDPSERFRALTAVAKATTCPEKQPSRWEDAVRTVADLDSADRAGVLAEIADAHPSPSELLTRVEAAAADLDSVERALVLVWIAGANPGEGERLLAAAEAIAAGLDSRERAEVLVAIAGANPAERERLVGRCRRDRCRPRLAGAGASVGGDRRREPG